MEKTKLIEVQLPKPFDKQSQFINDPNRYVLIEAGTKSGKTKGCALWIVKYFLENPGIYWWVAPVYGQAEIGYRNCKKIIPKELVSVSRTRLTISISEDWFLAFKSGEEPDNLYGEGVKKAVIDEASRLREESWHALRTTLTTTRGSVRIIGNPKGKRNWFYRICQKAKAGEPDYSYHHLTSLDNPYNKADEIEDARKLLPGFVFQELYEGIAQDDETGVFKDVRGHVKGYGESGTNYAGVDLGKERDNTVVIILNEKAQVVYFDRFPLKESWDLQKVKIKNILEKYKARAVVDSTGVGDPILEDLKRACQVSVEGFKFTSVSKQQLIESLIADWDHGLITFPELKDLIGELEIFEYKYTRNAILYSAPDGYHDDCVISLALANWGRKNMKTYHFGVG